MAGGEREGVAAKPEGVAAKPLFDTNLIVTEKAVFRLLGSVSVGESHCLGAMRN